MDGAAAAPKRGQFQFQAPFYVPVVFDPVSGIPMIPLYPAPREENPRQGGIYTVPMVGSRLPPIPFAYNAPLGIPFGREEPSGAADGSAAAGAAGAAAGAAAAAAAPQAGNRPDQQRRIIVRRFQVGFQLDLLLILKLVTMVFIFSQDGSRDRLLLLFLASIVYLYQTGALTPLLRWASERARRIMMPLPQPARNVPVPDGDHNHNVAAAAAAAAAAAPPAAAAAAVPAAENQNQPEGLQDGVAEVAAVAAAPPGIDEPQGQVVAQAQVEAQLGNWRGFVREVQMLVVGFVTSLLPGFHNID